MRDKYFDNWLILKKFVHHFRSSVLNFEKPDLKFVISEAIKFVSNKFHENLSI